MTDDFGDMFAVTRYEVPKRPARRDFAPWHKPRKQFVREDQWADEITWLLSKRDGVDDDLRYAGLPGPDLLDVRHFYRRFCTDTGRALRFLGFDGSARPGSDFAEALNVSLQEIRALPNVDDRSDVIGDDFRLLADSASIAWDRAKKLGPFDVVNLDLCGHFASDRADLDMSIYNATHALFGLQQRQVRPWSLFLTSRLDRTSIPADTLNALLTGLVANLETCSDFARAFDDHVGVQVSADAMTTWSDQEFFDAMAIGIAKWFLALANMMRSHLSIASAVGYRVVAGTSATDMLSLVLRFEPELTLAQDPSGLATSAGTMPSECEQATSFPGSIANLIDIDQRLKEEPTFRELLRNETADLLESARYDRKEYLLWADSQNN